MRFRVEGLEIRFDRLRLRVEGFRCKGQCLGLRVEGVRAYAVRFMVLGISAGVSRVWGCGSKDSWVSGLGSAQWRTRVLFPPHFQGHVNTFAPHEAVKLIACGELTADDRVVLHRVHLGLRGQQFTVPGV